MKMFDKGMVIRMVFFLVVLINQIMLMFGKLLLDIQEEQVNQFVDVFYFVGFVIFIIGMIFVVWFKNNYVIEKGKKQCDLLKENNLIK